MKTFEQRKKEIVEEIKDLQFATNPTEEKGLLWRWTKHGLNILSLYIDNAFSQSLFGSCDFLIETNRNYVLDSAISLLQKDKENKP